MDRHDFQHWLDRYVEAWRSYDAESIGELFAENATYRWHPWEDEIGASAKGRDAIVAAWLADRDDPGSWTADYRPWAVEDGRAVAVGVSRYLRADGNLDREYHNVFLCRFDEHGRCTEFTELFMRRPD